MDGPGIMETLPTNAPGLNGTRGDRAGGIIPTALTDGGKPGVGRCMCGGTCGVIGVVGCDALTDALSIGGTRGWGCWGGWGRGGWAAGGGAAFEA